MLVAKRKGKVPVTTYSRHEYATAPNLLKTEDVTGPGQALCADITYVRTAAGFSYLFLVTDLYSRTILGHCLSDSLSHNGAVVALKHACRTLATTVGVIHHSDRGSQYCCHKFRKALSDRGMRSSMTDANHCAQNAIAERVNGILKDEFYIDTDFPDTAHARNAIRNAINIYNNYRPHMSLGYSIPSEVFYAAL